MKLLFEDTSPEVENRLVEGYRQDGTCQEISGGGRSQPGIGKSGQSSAQSHVRLGPV